MKENYLKEFILILVTTFFNSSVFSQTMINDPVFEKTTHEALKIRKIILNEKETVIELNIKGDEGWFCVDTSYYIKSKSNVKKYRMIKANGVPLCPKSYKFNKDSLIFQLTFPAISRSINYIDLIEGCDKACVKVEGILINNKITEIKKGYSEAKKLFSTKDYSQSLKRSLEIKSIIEDTTILEYGQIILLIADNYLRLEDYLNAEKWYSKIFVSNLSDSMETNNFMDPYANFKYHAYKGIAYVYEYNQDWAKSLEYVILARKCPFYTYSGAHRLEEAVDILEWIVFLQEKMKNYNKAVYENLTFIIDNFGSGVRERLYYRTNQRLVKLVDSHYERYNFKAKLDSVLENIKITKLDTFYIASFNFLNQEYKIKINENQKDYKTDENYRQILGLENKIKDKQYFKNIVIKQLFYERIQLMSGQTLTKKGNLVYYIDKPYTGEFYEFWTSGNNRTKGEIKNGLFDGEFIYYYENGLVKETGKMANGKNNGLWETFYDNGAIESYGEFVDNMRNGKWIYWYPSGQQNVPLEFTTGSMTGLSINATSDKNLPKQKKAEFNYKNNLEDGLVTIWYDNNQIFRQGKYATGKREDEWKEWNREGKLVKEGAFKNGILIKGDNFAE